MNENRITQFESVLDGLIIQAGDRENTKIYPNAEVINASPADLPSGYIIVKSETGYYVPAVTVPGLIISDGDFVNLMYIKGTEPIAFQHGSGSAISAASSALVVNNDSGVAANVGDVGYIDVAGDYQTTTTASDNVSWCVVTVGGANATDIEVARTGRRTINYAGAAPSAGDFLVTSTTAGLAQQQTTVRSEIFAVCTAGGSGGIVEALLLTQTTDVTYTSTNPLIQNPTANSVSDFNGTIATLPGGAVLTYNVSSGDENWMDAVSSSALVKLRLYNSTRSEYALISDVVTATNTITLTANVPGTWATTDVITIRSQTNTNVNGGAYFLEYEITDEIPELARFVFLEVQFLDVGAVASTYLHPYEAYSLAKAAYVPSLSTAALYARLVIVPLIQRRFTIQVIASGSGTAIVNLYVNGYGKAAP